jgi:hypothetical protein
VRFLTSIVPTVDTGLLAAVSLAAVPFFKQALTVLSGGMGKVQL